MTCSPHATHHLACACREAAIEVEITALRSSLAAAEAKLADAERERDDALAAASIRAVEHRRERDLRAAAAARLARAEEALRFYAQKGNHSTGIVMSDAGDIARAALAPGEKEEGK